jgi:hypothetical protein
MSRIIDRAYVLAGFGLGMLLLPLLAGGQETSQEPETPTQPSSSQLVLPAPLGGFSPTLTFSETPAQTAKALTGSIGINALHSDNTFTANPLALGDYRYSIIPALGFRSVGAKTQWMLNYAGGLTLDAQLPDNTQTHAVNADLRQALTPRLTAEIRQDYTMTNNPATQIGAGQALPTLVGPGELSPFAVPSPIKQIASISNANLTYMLSQHSAAGVSGSFSLQDFREVPSTSPFVGSLIDTTNTAGRAFYLRQVSPHQTVGAEYQLQDLRFDGGRARTVDQVLFLFDGISFTPNMTLSLYAGPEHTANHNVAVLAPGLSTPIVPSLQSQWSAGGGIAYAWRGKANGLRLSAERGVSDGGGWLGAVRLNTASLALQKTLTARWIATLDLTYSDGHAIGIPANLVGARVTSEQGLLGFSYRVTRNLTASTSYARIRQPHLGPFVQALQPNYNQIQAGLTYQFEKAFSK